jgi:hypothetical protein
MIQIYLELTDGFRLDVDRLDVARLGYLSTLIDAPLLSLDVKRGKNRELDKFSTGTANLVFDNSDGRFNPLNTSSPLYGSIYPGRRIAVVVDGKELYSGFTGVWQYDFPLGGALPTARVSCVDGFASLSNQTVTFTAPQELSGARIQRILGLINFPQSDRIIDDGFTLCAAGDFSDTALNLLQQVELTEQGQLFFTAGGDLRFIERNPIAPPAGYSLNDSTGTGFQSVGVEYATDNLINSVTAHSSAGTATATNTSSTSVYQTQSQDLTTVHASVSDLQAFADYIVQEFGIPEYRIGSAMVNVDSYPVARNSEIGQILSVGFTPPGDSLLEQSQTIIGISHRATPSRWDTTVNLQKAIGVMAFRLNNPDYGVLDVNTLAY